MKNLNAIKFMFPLSFVAFLNVTHAFTVSPSTNIKSIRSPYVDKNISSMKLSPILFATTSEKETKSTNTALETDVISITEECQVDTDENLSESQKLLKKVKEAGTAGIISYALWELGFWAISIPVVIFGYYEVVGHMPDFSDKEDMAKLGGEAFAFVNFARFAVPLRIGLALSTTPWIQENVVDKFMKKDDNCAVEE